ncbi:MAG: DoxX family protein [Pseudomonadota bacterium]
MSPLSIIVGRFLLGLYFVLPGIMKFTDYERTIAYMQFHEIPFSEPSLVIAGVTNIVGGLLLMTGRHVKYIAFAFVMYVLAVNLMLHDFWTMEGDAATRETQNFVKNLGIVAGLLVLAGQAQTRTLQLKGWWRSDIAATRLFARK